MTTFLEVAQSVDKLLGPQGSVTSVEEDDYHGLLGKHISESWRSIQNLRKNWWFLYESVDINLVTTQTHYTIFNIFSTTTSPVKTWDTNRFVYDDDTLLTYIPYRNYIKEDWSDDTNEPTKFSIANDTSLYFNPVDQAYDLTAYYWKKPQKLSNNTDTVECPDEHLPALLYKACASIGMFLGSPETYHYYNILANVEMGNMLRSQNPGKRVNIRGIV